MARIDPYRFDSLCVKLIDSNRNNYDVPMFQCFYVPYAH